MITHILCPVDLSDISRRALQYAAAIARSVDARLRVILVLELVPPMPPGVWDARLGDEARAACQAGLEELVAPMRAAGVRLESVVTDGRPVPRILDEIASASIDLVVLGTHGHGGFERFALGSVADRVLRRATCPVLAIPPGDRHVPLREPFASVVCAVDFSGASLRALACARQMIRTGGALALVHAVEWPFGDPNLDPLPPEIVTLQHTLLEEAKRELHASLSAEMRAGLTIHEVVTLGRPSREILASARQRDADLVVMGVHGHSRVELGWLGSTLLQVVRDAPCPVLTSRA